MAKRTWAEIPRRSMSYAESRSILTNLLQFSGFCGLDGSDGNEGQIFSFPSEGLKSGRFKLDSVNTIIMSDILIQRPLVPLPWLDQQ
jgi:hypothetical protein